LLLAQMLGARINGERWGRRLTGRDLEEQLRQQRAARDEYERAHPEDLDELAALVGTAAQLR